MEKIYVVMYVCSEYSEVYRAFKTLELAREYKNMLVDSVSCPLDNSDLVIQPVYFVDEF